MWLQEEADEQLITRGCREVIGFEHGTIDAA
jgi:hypothetical protein